MNFIQQTVRIRLPAVRLALLAAICFAAFSLTTHAATVPVWNDLDWSPDGSQVLIGGAGVQLLSAELELLETVEEASDQNDIQGVAWKPDGSQFAYVMFNRETTTYSLIVRSADSLEIVAQRPFSSQRMTASPLLWGNRVLITASEDGQGLALWNPDSFEITGTIAPEAGERILYNSISFSENQSQLAYGIYRQSDANGFVFAVTQLDLSGGSTIRTLDMPSVGSTAWNGGRLAVASSRHMAVYDAGSGEVIQTFYEFDEDNQVTVDGLLWDHGGGRLAVIVNGSLEIWDAASGERLSVAYEALMNDTDTHIRVISRHPSARLIAAARWDGIVQVISFGG